MCDPQKGHDPLFESRYSRWALFGYYAEIRKGITA